MIFKNLFKLGWSAMAIFLISCNQPMQEVDILISNATIIDGSGEPSYKGSIAITDNKIIAIGELENIKAKKSIDAKNSVVAPGFIDIHSHSDLEFVDPDHHERLEPFVRQGITTSVVGNCGGSAAPMPEGGVEAHTGFAIWNTTSGKMYNTFNDYFTEVEKAKPVMNVAALVGHNTVRLTVLGDKDNPDQADLAEMRRHVKQAMEDGAYGISYGLEYWPGINSKPEELAEIARDVPDYNGMIAAHLRNFGDQLPLSTDEFLSVGKEIGVRHTQLSHWWALNFDMNDVNEAYAMVKEAQKGGMDVGMDIIMWLVAGTNLPHPYPSWSMKGGRDAFYNRLRSPEEREKIKNAWANPKKDWPLWDGKSDFPGPPDLAHAWVYNLQGTNYEKYDGWLVTDIAKEVNKEPEDVFMDVTLETAGKVPASFFLAGDWDIEEIENKLYTEAFKFPEMAVEIDAVGIPENPHPSVYGNYPKFFRLIRELNMISLEDGVRRCTSLPAEQVGIKNRGLLKEGYYADIVIFDSETIRDVGTFKDPFKYPKGVETVIINGQLAWHDNNYFGMENPSGQVLKNN